MPGRPAPKGSRIRTRHGTRPASKYEKGWTEAVATTCLLQWREAILPPPYRVEITFHFEHPARPAHEWPTRGDLDKLVRCTLDGLVTGRVLSDDRHVTRLAAYKRFARGAQEGAHIMVTTDV